MKAKYIIFPLSLCEDCAEDLEVKINTKRMIEDTCAECGDFLLCYQLETFLCYQLETLLEKKK